MKNYVNSVMKNSDIDKLIDIIFKNLKQVIYI